MWLFLCSLAVADPWAEVAKTAEMSTEEVKQLLAGVTKQQSVLDRMARPWEKQPWHRYAALFLTSERLSSGVDFWRAHAAKLATVSEQTGVPAEVIVAILGVETKYGSTMGNDEVIRSLFTLGMYHPRRQAFFREELGHYLRLAHDEGWDRHAVQGSYAGAMGIGQFMPSSYRAWAKDGDGDGKRDLFGSADDGIASVANYFVAHGWTPGEPVLVAAEGDLASQVRPGFEPDLRVSELQGLRTSAALPPDTQVKVFSFQLDDRVEYKLGLHNFYVITRYNRSSLYARVVFELAEQLREAYAAVP